MAFKRNENDIESGAAMLGGPRLGASYRIRARAALWKRAVRTTTNLDEARVVYAREAEVLGLGGRGEYLEDKALARIEDERSEFERARLAAAA